MKAVGARYYRLNVITPGELATSTITMRDDDLLGFFKGGGPEYLSRMTAAIPAQGYARRNRRGELDP